MTQTVFADALGVPVATLRNWEQGRTQPDPAALALLRIVEREPEAAFRALGVAYRATAEPQG
jgi:putative transcriptional regulator